MIKLKVLSSAVATTSETGVVTLAGVVEEQSIFESITTIAALPFKISEDDTYVNSSVAATGALAWGLGLFHVADFVHAKRGSKPISPITGLIAKK